MNRFKKISFIFLGILLISFLIGIYFFTSTITGKVSFQLDSEYHEGEKLNGTLKISVEEGELIPANSKVIFENNGSTYEYDLSEVISEDQISGSFYVSGTSINGSGSGYGLIGTRENQVVSFELNIVSESERENNGNRGNGNNQDNNSDTNVTNNESEEANSTENTGNETNTEEETNVSETSQEETQNEEVSGEETVNEESNEEQTEESQDSQEESNEEPNLSPITGEAVLSIEEKISGEVYFGEEFVYELEDGQTAELVSGSVKANSNNLRDNQVSVQIVGNEVIVTTSYSNSSEGFGEEYSGSSTKDLVIDLSSLDFNTSPGELKISLTYEGNEFISLTTQLQEGEVSAESDVENNLTIIESQPVILSDNEREIIINEFGNVSVQITRADRTNDGVITRFELGEFWVENYYTSDLSDEELKNQVEEDRIRFLKDLANRFSSNNELSREVEGIVGNYEI